MCFSSAFIVPSGYADMHRTNPISAALLMILGSFLPSAGCNSKPTSKNAKVLSPPNRIVTIAPNAAEIITALGEADRLVAVSKFCIEPKALAALPRIGGLFNPDLESILRLKPDLLILRGSSPELERMCRSNDIRIYHDPTESVDDIYTAVAQMGTILHKSDAASSMIQNMKNRINRINSSLSGLPRPRVLFTIARDLQSLSRITTAGRGTFIDQMITLAGGENVFGTLQVAYPEVSLEDVLAARPDVIIEAMPEQNELAESDRQRILRQWKKLGPLPACRSGRVYQLTDDHLLIPSPRVVDAIARIAHLLHPEVSFD